MKKLKLLFATSVLVSLLCSCGEKETPTPTPPVAETPDKVVIKLEAPFSYTIDETERKTSFDSLNVKAVVKIDNETIPLAVDASNGFPWTFEKEISLSGKTSIAFEFYSEFSPKDENNLPTHANLIFNPKGTFTFYKDGKEIRVGSKTQIDWGQICMTGYNMKRQAEKRGISAVKKTLETQKSLGTSKGTIAW